MKKIRWIVETVLFFVIAVPIAILPYKISIRIGTILGYIVFYTWKSRRDIAINNIKNAVKTGSLVISKMPELIILDNFINYFCNFVDVIKIYFGRGQAITANLRIEGFEHFDNALSKNKGVLFITGHCGNWELLPIAFSQYFKISVVARPLNNIYLNKVLENFRKRYTSIIHKKGAAKGVLSTLKRGGVVGLLIDQRVSQAEGVMIYFLGRQTYVTKLPVVLAQKTKTSILPVFIKKRDSVYTIEIGKEIELVDGNDKATVSVNTERCSKPIEDYIKHNPSEWLWIHRRWKHTPV